MDREEAIEYLTILGGIGGITDNEAMALEIAINALEQEPVLDKIRAEIEKRRQRYDGSMYYIEAAREQELSWVLEVIDQYKPESENKE